MLICTEENRLLSISRLRVSASRAMRRPISRRRSATFISMTFIPPTPPPTSEIPPIAASKTVKSCACFRSRQLSAFDASHPPIEQGERHVIERGQAGQKVERLEDKADVAVAQIGQHVGVGAGHVDAIKLIAPRRRPVEQSEKVHQGALPRSRSGIISSSSSAASRVPRVSSCCPAAGWSNAPWDGWADGGASPKITSQRFPKPWSSWP